jgi:hypothetical protein
VNVLRHFAKEGVRGRLSKSVSIFNQYLLIGFPPKACGNDSFEGRVFSSYIGEADAQRFYFSLIYLCFSAPLR